MHRKYFFIEEPAGIGVFSEACRFFLIRLIRTALPIKIENSFKSQNGVSYPQGVFDAKFSQKSL